MTVPVATSLPWLGVNFWSRAGGPRMWSERYDGGVVREELATLAAHGLDVTRSFCFWPDFVPEPERLDDDVAARFADFLDAHLEHGMRTIPTLLVGHMSGENWDPPWRGDRDLYRDVWLVSQQAWLAAELARRFGRHPAVCGWLVSNEMPLYGGPATTEEITAWARIVVQGLRSGGADQPVSLGDGAWGIEVTGADNGFSLRALAPLVDFVGPHSYPMQDDELRQILSPPSRASSPVGSASRSCSRSSGSPRTSPRTRTQPRTTARCSTRRCSRGRAAGSPGATPISTASAARIPIGTTSSSSTSASRTGGQAEEQLGAMRDFAGLVRDLAADGWEPSAPPSRSSSPSTSSASCPSPSPPTARTSATICSRRTSPAARPTCLSGSSASATGSRPTPACCLAPCAKLLTGPGLDRLHRLVHDGATLYLSYFAGSTTNQRGPWLSWLPSSSAWSIGSATGSPTRSRTTSSSSSSSRTWES